MKRSRLRERKMGKSLVKKKPRKRVLPILVLVLFLITLLVLGLFIFVKSAFWNGKAKLSVSVQKKDGDVAVVILDPILSSITTLDIPAETEVQAAYQLGTWKIGSITKLGNDKRIEKDFLKNTVIKSFSFPIDTDADESFLDLTSGNLLKELNAIFRSSSPFSIFERIKISLFSLQINDVGRYDIDLSKTNQLMRAKLLDGTLGFQVSENIPTNIESYFTVNNKGQQLNLLINNGTLINRYATFVGRVLEALGVNVTSIQNVNLNGYDCKVTGLSKDVVEKIAMVFSCDTDFSSPVNNFDLQIDIGEKFKGRF